MVRENDITPLNACEIEKNLKVVGVCNPNHWKKDGWKGLKNACKIGILKGRFAYVVTLEMVEGKEVMKVHTIKRVEGDEIETLEGNLARNMFNKLFFY